ncbi:MAG: TraK family protein [Halodesulfovibrio sp.]|uniref:TraK family protein n=1 Tax=Halodesulfovibrio sp. TaxID=1912772 RepID=UPI00359D48DE
MSNEVDGKKKGFAKIEFLAVQPEAIALLEAGHTFRSAYEDLKGSGKITMSYQRFVWLSRNGVKSRLEYMPTCNRGKKENDTEPVAAPAPEASVPQQQEAAQEKVLGVVETNSFKKSSSNKKDLI